jgi:hypothetical protein
MDLDKQGRWSCLPFFPHGITAWVLGTSFKFLPGLYCALPKIESYFYCGIVEYTRISRGRGNWVSTWGKKEHWAIDDYFPKISRPSILRYLRLGLYLIGVSYGSIDRANVRLGHTSQCIAFTQPLLF